MNPTAQEYKIILACPWCGRGMTMADNPANVNVSCKCNVCGNYYTANLMTSRVYKSKAAIKFASAR